MALSTENRINVKLELSWLRARGTTVFVTTPTEDDALAALTSDQEAMIAALIPRLDAVACAAVDPEVARVKRVKDFELFEGALSNLNAQREDIARQIADVLGLIDYANESGAFAVSGQCARSSFMDCDCDGEETTS
jgi:hypothetical protein